MANSTQKFSLTEENRFDKVDHFDFHTGVCRREQINEPEHTTKMIPYIIYNVTRKRCCGAPGKARCKLQVSGMMEMLPP